MSDARQTPRGSSPRPVRVHYTNVNAMGPVQLARSLLPELESCPGYVVEALYLPAAGEFGTYCTRNPATRVERTVRRLPNSVSRLLECTVGARRFEADSPLLVLGDLPLRCRGRQTVFVQTTLLTESADAGVPSGSFRHRVARQVFRANQHFARAFVVQSEAMRRALAKTYPEVAVRTQVIGQPVPKWLERFRGWRPSRLSPRDASLRLLYPGADYPHKNHGILRGLEPAEAAAWPVASMVFTVSPVANPNPGIPWIECVGVLESNQMVQAYLESDAVVYLSRTESYGFPLVEAMWVGLPVICPDVDYARVLCGDGAIYFDLNDVQSLGRAVDELRRRLHSGWWPDWSRQLRDLPTSWSEVASRLLDAAAG